MEHCVTVCLREARVMDYINRLDNYDGPEIAKIAVGEPYHLYEEVWHSPQLRNHEACVPHSAASTPSIRLA
eukprot:3382731-Amphidinium_carterae.1